MAEPRGRGRPPKKMDFDKVGGLVMKELLRRLERPIDAAEIPGTQLMQIAQKYMAFLAEKKEEQAYIHDYQRMHPLDLIDQEGLPLKYRYEILWEYLDVIQDEERACSDRVREMRIELGIDEAPEEVQDDAA